MMLFRVPVPEFCKSCGKWEVAGGHGTALVDIAERGGGEAARSVVGARQRAAMR